MCAAFLRYGVSSQEQLGKGFTDKIPLPPHAGEANDITFASSIRVFPLPKMISTKSSICYM
jgi:hypothetical protein